MDELTKNHMVKCGYCGKETIVPKDYRTYDPKQHLCKECFELMCNESIMWPYRIVIESFDRATLYGVESENVAMFLTSITQQMFDVDEWSFAVGNVQDNECTIIMVSKVEPKTKIVGKIYSSILDASQFPHYKTLLDKYTDEGNYKDHIH